MGTLTKSTPAGTEYWTVPAGVNEIQIECWGAGGHGFNAMDGGNGPGGGGGGGYCSNSVLVLGGTVLTLQVGDGTLTADSPRGSEDTMASFVKQGATLLASGIAGEDAVDVNGAAGGQYTGSGTEVGNFGGAGGNGGTGDGGGGGGGAGSASYVGGDGVAGTTNGGAGGTSNDVTAGGAGGNSGAPDGTDGTSDVEGGSGGGGTYRINSTVSGNGGSPGGGGGGCNTGYTSNGGNGQIRITWTDPVNVPLSMMAGY